MESINYKEIGHSELGHRVETLKRICSEIDPYSPLPFKVREQLKELNIYDWSDPFRLTNQLIMLMEDALSELQLREEKAKTKRIH